MKARKPAVVPPLTSKTRKGHPYARFADVTDAIAQALSLPKEHWEEWAARSDTTRLPPEALVFLVKHIAGTDKNIFGKLVWQLHLRIEKVVKRWALGFDRVHLEELIETVQQKVIGIVLAEPASRQSEFLEIAFKKAVQRHTLNAIERRKSFLLPMRASRRTSSENDEEDVESPTDSISDDSPQVEELVSMLQDKAQRGVLLSRIKAIVKKPQHYEALLLHYGQGWPLKSIDPAQPSLENHFHRSERQIRNWIGDAIAAIQTALENTHDA
jgi:hypothetical protein